MKKVVAVCCIAALIVAMFPLASYAERADRQGGGIVAFFLGCCLGLRVGTEWNEGAQIHWREWVRLVPYAGIVFSIWDGIQCAQGITAHEWSERYGANWY